MITTGGNKGIVVVGQVGAGKSSLLNLLVKKDCFKSQKGGASVTVEISEVPVIVPDHPWKVFDVPGLADVSPNETLSDDAITRGLVTTFKKAAGFDEPVNCVLWVVEYGRFTKGLVAIITNLLLYTMGKECLKNVVFAVTKCDKEEDFTEKDAQDFIEDARRTDLKEIINGLDNRIVFIHNPSKKEPKVERFQQEPYKTSRDNLCNAIKKAMNAQPYQHAQFQEAYTKNKEKLEKLAIEKDEKLRAEGRKQAQAELEGRLAATSDNAAAQIIRALGDSMGVVCTTAAPIVAKGLKHGLKKQQ